MSRFRVQSNHLSLGMLLKDWINHITMFAPYWRGFSLSHSCNALNFPNTRPTDKISTEQPEAGLVSVDTDQYNNSLADQAAKIIDADTDWIKLAK